MQSPLNKVVFIQRVAAFAPLSLNSFIRLAYVNQSWADTIQNYSSHLVEERVRSSGTTVDTFRQPASQSSETFSFALKCDIPWLLNVLLCKSLLSRSQCLLLLDKNKTSLATTKFVFDRIVEVGGLEVLKAQLASIDWFGRSCLMNACGANSSSSAEIVEFILNKILEAGGPQFLKTRLTASDSAGWTCLMVLCEHGNSPTSLKKIELLLNKSFEVGGCELLATQFTMKTDSAGTTCLMIACFNSSSSCELLKLLLNTIVKAGGSSLLQSQLTATSYGRTCFQMLWESPSSCPEAIRLVAAFLHHFNLFEQQYTNHTNQLGDCNKVTLKEKAFIDDVSWTPEIEEENEVKRILKIK